jgi:alkanesulfonate monooxygenase SsuD/methylene tetrahydromethanopterin reductase-like flavin-dependent oxidoreductase (luciferase family)
MFGYPFDTPTRHMREYLAVLLPLLREGRVSFSGETLRAGLTAPCDHDVRRHGEQRPQRHGMMASRPPSDRPQARSHVAPRR